MAVYGERQPSESSDMGFSPEMQKFVDMQKRLAEEATAKKQAETTEMPLLQQDVRRIARLALDKSLPTNVDVALPDHRLQGWRLKIASLNDRGEFVPGQGSLPKGEYDHGYYKYNEIGCVEKILEANAEGSLWVVTHRAYTWDAISLDDPTRIEREHVVDNYTRPIDLSGQNNNEWLTQLATEASVIVNYYALPGNIRSDLSVYGVRRNLL